MRNFLFILLTAFFLGPITAICSSIDPARNSTAKGFIKGRTTATCADPTLADVFVEAFSSKQTTHVIRARWAFVSDVSNGGDWQIQGEVFQAWQTAQEFTVPLYQLFNPTTTDFIFLPSTNGSPPTKSGFETEAIIGYVYSTKICNSVPLLVASLPSGDHWYTTSQREHDSLVTNGWVDEGTVAFVLPLNSDCACTNS